jgi:hypothetical protein
LIAGQIFSHLRVVASAGCILGGGVATTVA